MAAADCAGGGTRRPVRFRGGNFALLCGHRAFSGKLPLRTWQSAGKVECGGHWRRLTLGAFCAPASTRTDRPIRDISIGGRTERSRSASRSGARVAERQRRFPFPIADGFLEWERDGSAAARSPRFFRARASSAVRGKHSFAVKSALERADAVSVSVLQAETGARRSTSVGRRRAALSGVFILPGGVGVSADRLSGMRRREPR